MEERKPRKLLIATIGVAAVTYAACGVGVGPGGETSGNLMPPPDTGASEISVDDGFVLDLGTDTSRDTAVEDARADAEDSNDGG